jgi:hypothetical protein
MKTRHLNAMLWTSAAALTMLILVVGSPLLGSPARAEMVARAGEFTMMTTDSGTEEVLVVLDNRSEQMMVYHVRGQKTVELLQNLSIAKLFESAKAAASGR